MGSVTDLFNLFMDTINAFIGTGSAAAEGFVNAGSSAAEGVYGTITGSLGDVVNG